MRYLLLMVLLVGCVTTQSTTFSTIGAEMSAPPEMTANARPTPDLATRNERVISAVSALFAGYTPSGQPRLRAVGLRPPEGADIYAPRRVLVEISAEERIADPDALRSSIENDVFKAFAAIFGTGVTVAGAQVDIYLSDGGSTAMVYSAELDGQPGTEVDWARPQPIPWTVLALDERLGD